MAMHLMNIRCPECWHIYSVRRPNDTTLVPAILRIVRCPACHPEALAGCCSACRLPLALLRPPKRWGTSGYHSDLCFSCFQSERRFKRVTKDQPLLP